MSSLVWIAIGIPAFLALVLAGYLSVWVVDQDTVIVVKRWGKHHRIIEAGFNLRWLFADQKHRIFSKQQQVLSLELQGDAGGKLPVWLKVNLTLVETMDHEVIRRLAYQAKDPRGLLKVRAEAVMMQLLLPMTFERVLADTENDALQDRFRLALNSIAEACGFKIIALHITSIQQPHQVRDAIIASETAATVRLRETADATHRNTLKRDAATAEVEASKITAAGARDRLSDEVGTLKTVISDLVQGGGLSERSAASVVAALIYQQTAANLAHHGKAQVILPPPGVDISALQTGVRMPALNQSE